MNGFFTRKETESKSRPDGRALSCAACGLYKHCDSPKMTPYGNFRRRIMNIGEAPGMREDEMNMPFQGKTGTLLKDTYKQLGIDLFEDCINLNAVNCRPIDNNDENRTPTSHELDCCRRIVLEAIEKYKPRVIVLFGASALYSLIAHRWRSDLGGITRWRGFAIPDQDFKAFICPTFHPSFVERSNTNDIITIWKRDLEQITKYSEEKFLMNDPYKITQINDLSVLSKIRSSTYSTKIALDYETTGLKPHAAGHKIICASMAVDKDNAFVFEMPERRLDRQPFIELLADPMIEKMSHNMKFEQSWSTVRLRQTVNNFVWDSMIAAHILDNRQNVTGLKFQTYVNFGVIDYASDITPYLQAVDDKNANSINRINELIQQPAGLQKLLEYCALDSIWEYRLAMKQMELIGYDLPF